MDVLRLRLSLLMFLQWALPASLLPLYSLYLKERLGFDDLLTATCCATQAVAVAFSSLITGQVADRWLPAQRALAACAALAGLDLWLLAEVTAPAAVLLLTLAFWLLVGPLLLLGTTITFSHLEAPDRQFSGVRLWGTVGWIAMSWLIGCWLNAPGWLCALRGEPDLADAFRLGGVLAFAVAAYALTLPATPPTPLPAPGRALAPLAALRLLRGWRFTTYALCVLGTCVTFSFTTQNTPLLLHSLGVPHAWLQPALTLSQASEVLFLALLPLMLRRFSVRGTMLLGLLALAVGLGVLALGRPVFLVIASQGLNGLFVAGFLVCGQMFLNGRADGDLRASMQGLYSCLNGLGLLVGNLLAGWLRAWAGGDLPPTFAVGAAITTLVMVVFALGFRGAQGEKASGAA